MKVFSIISMVVFTLTIWGAFGVIYAVEHTPSLTVSEVGASNMTDSPKYTATIKLFDVAKDVSTEEKTTPAYDNVYEQASSSANDILYSFERDQPVSVDQLLVALGINQ